MTLLPDDTLVGRGGQNLVKTGQDNYKITLAVAVIGEGRLEGVSLNAAPGLALDELTAADARTGYPVIPHNEIGVTTVGAVRAAEGDVVSDPTRSNPKHPCSTA